MNKSGKPSPSCTPLQETRSSPGKIHYFKHPDTYHDNSQFDIFFMSFVKAKDFPEQAIEKFRP
jgi:hypothetical protein